ncbi:MAG: ABC transporter permease [Coxiellaceae bacterium]|nr:ABC transporter permease [Coxiellaceae bacterium]
MTAPVPPASMDFQENTGVVILSGAWRVGYLSAVEHAISQVHLSNPTMIDAAAILEMDTAGAYLLYCLQNKLAAINDSLFVSNLKHNFQALLTLVGDEYAALQVKKIVPKHYNIFYRIGKSAVEEYYYLLKFLAFFGEVMVDLILGIMRPLKLQWRSMVNEIDVGGYRALPIVAVMMALIGVVVAYQLGVQLRIYAANAYVVDLSGVAILREFSPLIVSVIIAGRTSTSFAALIGTMKVNEELDALRTMGLSPIERLVLPKILGLMLALPLLVVWGDIFGLFGSMIMAKSMMGIGFKAFLVRFQQNVAIKHLYIGLVKTPFFAMIIAGIGCYQGFQAEGSAESVGQRTTIAAVQSIFLIILADGLFSILFNWLDI